MEDKFTQTKNCKYNVKCTHNDFNFYHPMLLITIQKGEEVQYRTAYCKDISDVFVKFNERLNVYECNVVKDGWHRMMVFHFETKFEALTMSSLIMRYLPGNGVVFVQMM
jgi:hypothetical protein